MVVPHFMTFEKHFDFYSKLYLKINHASKNLKRGLDHIYYLACTFSKIVLLSTIDSPIEITDDLETIDKKLALVLGFLRLSKCYVL